MAPSRSTKQPQSLAPYEKCWARILGACGLILIIGTLFWYAASHGGAKTTGPSWALVTKVTTITEPKEGPKETTTTEYGETVVIFALTIGAAMLLCAAFYGRIREIKVEGIDLTLEPTEAAAVDQGVKAGAKQAPNALKKAAVEPLAKAVAQERASKAILEAARGLPADRLEEIGKEATEDLLGLLA